MWSEKAVKEAQRVGSVKIAATTKDGNFARVPRQDELKLSADAAYVHMTSNNTIYGTQFHYAAGDRRRAARQRRLVGHLQPADRRRETRADLRGRAEEPRPVGRHASSSSATISLKRSPASLATMLSYNVHAENKSLYNTPPVFGIYILGLVLKWMRRRRAG